GGRVDATTVRGRGRAAKADGLVGAKAEGGRVRGCRASRPGPRSAGQRADPEPALAARAIPIRPSALRPAGRAGRARVPPGPRSLAESPWSIPRARAPGLPARRAPACPLAFPGAPVLSLSDDGGGDPPAASTRRSEEHTSE